MADEMILRAQRWVNSTYKGTPGFQPVQENGRTGWPTMYALTRALQIELGVPEPSDTFGPVTLDTLSRRFPVVNEGIRRANIIRIVQSGLYCKGYRGSELGGGYDSVTAAAVAELKADMGVNGVFTADGVVPKVFKALLTMDAYVVVTGGTERVRGIQKWLNAAYVGRRDFFIMPCDGHFSRDVQKALLLAVQFELGMDDDTATGRFGPATQAGIKRQAIFGVGASDSTRRFVRLFQAAMIFNGRPVPFDGSHTSAVAGAVTDFQRFARLEANGTADYRTWASLLVSTGDPTRRGTACDCVTEITAARARTLRTEGYTTVGRYLSNVPGSSLNKKIQPGELGTMVSAGLSVFPIYQTDGGSADYFSAAQGGADALAALDAARGHGFRRGTTIYFAVDFDALDGDVTERIIPHFQALADRLASYGSEYRIGVYGSRNVCDRLARTGLTTSSFVSGMSTGFSGNLGSPLPSDWAFDQISTVTVGADAGRIEIDNNIASGRDAGQAQFLPPPPGRLDVGFDMARRGALLADVRGYLDSIGVTDLPGRYLNFTEHSLDVLLRHDTLITAMSRAFRMRKALVQCPIFWAVRGLTPADPLADGLVTSYYGYKIQYEAWERSPAGPAPAFPPLAEDDSSTGLGQIFARAAIRARNHAVARGIIGGPPYNADDWHDMWTVWQALHGDDDYSVGTVPLVLIQGAAEIGVTGAPLDYDENATRGVLARYNGRGAAAEEYGRQLLGLYRVFEGHNAAVR